MALTLNIGGVQQAFAQTKLPDVTVDAPKPRARQTAQRTQATSTRAAQQRRVATRNLPPRAPVPYMTPSTGTIGAPPSPYAGGQVASGGGLGLLGNRSVMNTPFNQTNFTSQLMQNQQARTIRDVLINDPSVRTVQAAGGGADSLFIRGFQYDSGDYALNGLAGIAPYYSTSANFIERVELLKGPGALLNGMTVGGTGASSGGAVGGSVNLVTKHAPDRDITQLTTTYASKSQFGEQMDVSRRFGEHKEWGVRFNGGYSNGDTPWNRQHDELGNAHLAVDYHGENVRIDADVGYQADNLTPPLRFFGVNTATVTSIPAPPAAGTNFQVPWAYYVPTDFYSTIKGEVDLNDKITAYASFGYHDSNINYRYPSPILNSNAGAIAVQNPGTGSETYTTYAGEAGFRATADTGPVKHVANVGYSITDRTYSQNLTTSAPISWNLYTEPTNVALPGFPTLSGSQRVGANLWSVGVSDTMSILNERVQLTVGVRRQTAGTELANYLPNGVSRPFADTSVWTPAYTVVVKPVEHVSLYANYIEGLQTPVVVPTGYTNTGAVFAPGQTKQVETGIKVDFGRITTTVSAFDITKPSVITTGTVGQLTQVMNGLQRNTGAEFNVFGELTPTLRLLGGVAYIHGVQEKTGTANDGKRAVGVPELTVNLGAEWDTPFVRDLTLTGRVVYTGEQYVDTANKLSLPDWTRVDLGARYTFTSPWNGKPIVVRASVENVFNKAYWASAYSGVITLGAPRTYLMSTTFNF
ncbi:putative ferric siderophore receptor protein precursor [Bradyrhizobium oligotrophicum S58]|uniref:Putative ferric siderophore receptor protein n=1 Tax=Bradyrhizobium oligotrophicum S58 TaxID=1245469 RepID=M4ZC15_9BRAD|nr:putative ferric siderophore receptor protein precursor [Bradyrhizobium oligotrophicum S58]